MKKFKSLIEAVNDKSRVRGYTHRFYTYPAGFSPKFVESAIKTFTKKKELVLDPFIKGSKTNSFFLVNVLIALSTNFGEKPAG